MAGVRVGAVGYCSLKVITSPPVCALYPLLHPGRTHRTFPIKIKKKKRAAAR